MRRALVVIPLLCLVAYGVVWIAAVRESAKVVKSPWPGDLGSLESFAERFPRQAESAAARRLAELAEPLDISFARSATESTAPVHTTLQGYVNREAERGDLAIAEPPADAAAWLASHAIAIVAIREHLLSSGEIAWERDLSAGYQAPTPNLAAHLKLTRLLVANALMRARNGDAGAWTDLQAARNLSRSLHGHPELIVQIVALAMARTINAASWKMPLPPPPWVEDGEDYVRVFQRSIQYDQWLLWKHGPSTNRILSTVAKPFTRLEISEVISRQLDTARRIDGLTACDFDAEAFYRGHPNLALAWRRAFRYRVEREAARIALRARAGGGIEAKSRCSDGQWSFDGAWVRFSREIRKTPREAVMPLAVRVVGSR